MVCTLETPIHAGEILGDELEETNLSARKLADIIEAPPNRLYQLVAGQTEHDGGYSLAPQPVFRASAEFRMNLQTAGFVMNCSSPSLERPPHEAA